MRVNHGELTQDTLREIRAELEALHAMAPVLKEFSIVVDLADDHSTTAEITATDHATREYVGSSSAANVLDAVVRSVAKIQRQLRQQQSATKAAENKQERTAAAKRTFQIAVGIGVGLVVLGVVINVARIASREALVDPALRKPTFPVSGELVVDGVPEAGAIVVLHPADERVANEVWPYGFPRGTVDPKGFFRIGTYELQDGAPEGEYLIVVVRRSPPRPQEVAFDEASVMGDVRTGQPKTGQPVRKPANEPQSAVRRWTVEPKKNKIPRLELSDRS
jgi:hypothetical protein